jgi:hypothetical protein
MVSLLYRPFGGPPVPFYTYIQWMLDHGILFSTMFGIGQLLVKERGITTHVSVQLPPSNICTVPKIRFMYSQK